MCKGFTAHNDRCAISPKREFCKRHAHQKEMMVHAETLNDDEFWKYYSYIHLNRKPIISRSFKTIRSAVKMDGLNWSRVRFSLWRGGGCIKDSFTSLKKIKKIEH